MRILALHTNPFDLGAHLTDDHEMETLTVEIMDSDELRRCHAVLHQHSRRNRDHIHSDDEDLIGTSVVLD